MPGEGVFARVFPEGGLSDFLASNGTASASDVRLVATRIADLGGSHVMAALATELEARAVAIEAAQKAQDDAVRARKLAEAEDELAQAALRRAYEANALDARKKLGKTLAERLFPRLRRRPATAEAGEPAAGGDGGGG